MKNDILDITGEDSDLPETKLLSKGDIKSLKKWIPSKYKDRPLQRVFQLTKDFTNIQTLTNKLKGIGATLIVIKTQDGKRFGGFMNKDWKKGIDDSNKLNYGAYFGSKRAFLFSLDHKEKYGLLNPGFAGRYDTKQFGPCFGMDLYVNLSQNVGNLNKMAYDININKICRSNTFMVEEMEIFAFSKECINSCSIF